MENEARNEAMEPEVELEEGLKAATEPEEASEETQQADQPDAEAQEEAAAGQETEKKRTQDARLNQIAAAARRDAAERIRRENDVFAREMGFADFDTMKRETVQARREAQEAEIREKLEEGDLGALDPLIRQRIADLPEMQAVRELQEARREQVDQQVYSEAIRELNEHYPDSGISSIEDLFQNDYAQEIIDACKNGMPMFRAYAAYAADEIAEKKAAAAKRAALLASGKDHLKPAGGTGAGRAEVPRDVMEAYRRFNPTATDVEILAHWKKNHEE